MTPRNTRGQFPPSPPDILEKNSLRGVFWIVPILDFFFTDSERRLFSDFSFLTKIRTRCSFFLNSCIHGNYEPSAYFLSNIRISPISVRLLYKYGFLPPRGGVQLHFVCEVIITEVHKKSRRSDFFNFLRYYIPGRAPLPPHIPPLVPTWVVTDDTVNVPLVPPLVEYVYVSPVFRLELETRIEV